ncbi:MAG: CDP-alcohol phosphatidyltransferase family protein [Clostridiales bacterium]|nr:CDP-alcohol phosphatidyltransferase family protein [Clostridiales bacterium]
MIGIYDYTVILTYLSMISGCTGIIISMSGVGHPYVGALFLMVSGLCDAFDGRVARSKKNRTQLEKNFGVQIDSMSDLIAFGVLPAAIGIAMLRSSPIFTDRPYWVTEQRYEWYPILLAAIGVFYVLAGLIRLAYFNATEDIRNKEAEEKGSQYFTGLPITTASLVFPLILIIHYFVRFDFSIVYFVMMFILAVLFLGGFKIKKPGKAGILAQVAIGAIEFIMIVGILLANFI